MSRQRLSTLLRGHILLFDRAPAPAPSPRTGARLLLTAAVLEIGRIAAETWFLPGIPLWLFLPLLVGLALLLVWILAGVSPSQLGLRPWSEWNATEKAYLVQVVILANVVFVLVLGGAIAQRHAGWRSFAAVFAPYLAYGFYQELVYRGMVQTELVRRWRAIAGILAANVLYTFGPLHSYWFTARASTAVPMFASIFVMGLFFGAVFRRSGNLWLPGVFHALGNAYVIAATGPLR